MFNYENFLEGQLNKISDDLSFRVVSERAFLEGGISENVCYAVVKYLASEIQFGFIKRQPVNITILGLPSNRRISDVTNIVNNFVAVNNYTQLTNNDGTIKQEYMTPFVADIGYDVGYTKRPIIYLSGTLYIMEQVGDLGCLKIDGEDVIPLAFNYNYTMQPNTQPDSTEYLAKSVKSSASLSVTMAVPLVNTSFVNKVLKVSNGANSGNSDFAFVFDVSEIPFTYNLKLTSCQFTTAPNSVPTLVLAFMR